MEITIKCPNCSIIFSVSEQFQNKTKTKCKCGWQFNISQHLNCCLKFLKEPTDERKTKFNSLEEMAALAINPYYSHPWLESRFATIPEETMKSFNELIAKLKSSEKRIKTMRGFISKYLLGHVKIFNDYVPVWIGNFPNAAFEGNRIIIPFGDTNNIGDINKTEISRQIQHEIAHAVDKKLLSKKWTGPSDKYKTLMQRPTTTYSSQEDLTYLNEPIEFDAIGTAYATSVKGDFESLDVNKKQQMIKEFDNWLEYDGDNLPLFNVGILPKWKTKPTLYRNFQQKVYTLVQELKQILADELKKQNKENE